LNIDVETDAYLRADGLAHRPDLGHRLLHDVARGHLVVRAEPALADRARRIAGPDDVGLEHRVTARRRLSGDVGQILQAPEWLGAEELPVVRPVGREMRPVDPLPLAVRAAISL